MAKVEDALRDMIIYHGRRAAREIIGQMPAQLRQVRRDTRNLERAVEELTRQVRHLAELEEREKTVPAAPVAKVERARFSKRTLKSIRRRLDLTQQELARLLEVSHATVAAWESGKTRPRKTHMARIVALRDIGRAEVDKALGREETAPAVSPDLLKRLRKRLNLTQTELARLVGVSTATVTSWETGKSEPARDRRKAIAGLRRMRPEQVDEQLGRRGAPESEGLPVGEQAREEVKQTRQALGLSQKALAEKLGVSTATIWNWEAGNSTPRARNLEGLRALAAGMEAEKVPVEPTAQA